MAKRAQKAPKDAATAPDVAEPEGARRPAAKAGAGGKGNRPQKPAKSLKKRTATLNSGGAEAPKEIAPAVVLDLAALRLDAPITLQAAGELAGVTGQFISRLSAEGYVPRTAGGKVRVIDVFQGYLRFFRDEGRRANKSASASRVQDARAEEIALRTDERRKRLLAEAQTEALGIIDEFFGGLRAALNSLPANATKDLALRRKLQNGIDGAFGEASRNAVASAPLAGAGGTLVRAAGATAPRRMGKR